MTSRQDTSLSIRVLDGFFAESNAHGRISIKNRKACGLLAYLALSPHGSETRERLAGLLWSDRGEEQARASLRQCLKQLRSTFDEIGYSGFQSERQEITLDLAGVHIDLKGLSDQINEGHIDTSLLVEQIDPHRILYGLEDLDPGFSAWLHVLRHRWSENLASGFQSLLQNEGLSDQVRKTVAEALLKIDHTHEEAHRFVIRCHADAGNTGAALKQYKILWDLLDDEYDMEPAEETKTLIANIKTGSHASLAPVTEASAITPPVTRIGGSASRLPTIGVCDFVQGGPWRQESYLIQGFRRELIASLIRFREWVVVEGVAGLSTDLDRLSGAEPDMPFDHQLEGAFHEKSDTIHMTLTLKDTTTRRYIWSEQIVLTLENWFEAQQDIVRRISIALNVYLSAERLARISEDPHVPVGAYDRWLFGQELTLQWRPDSHARAKAIFQAVIDEAPNFGRAYSSLVQIHNAAPLVHLGAYRTKSKNQDTLRLAREAVQIDPLDSRAQLCLGWTYAINGQYDHAELHLGLACELNRNDPWTLVSAALGWSFCDQAEIGTALASQALSLNLNPSKSHWGYQATIRFISGDYEGCISAIERADEALHILPAWKAAALIQLGRRSEAEAEARYFCDLTRKNWSGESEPDDGEVIEWLLQCFPIKNNQVRQQLADGFMGLGVSAP